MAGKCFEPGQVLRLSDNARALTPGGKYLRDYPAGTLVTFHRFAACGWATVLFEGREVVIRVQYLESIGKQLDSA